MYVFEKTYDAHTESLSADIFPEMYLNTVFIIRWGIIVANIESNATLQAILISVS